MHTPSRRMDWLGLSDPRRTQTDSRTCAHRESRRWPDQSGRLTDHRTPHSQGLSVYPYVVGRQVLVRGDLEWVRHAFERKAVPI